MRFVRFLTHARTTLNRYLADGSTVAWQAHPAEELRKLHIVIGNESCDLDSAVSALTLAFIYSERSQEHDYVPVLNIPRRDYRLKTEVGHMLSKCGIAEAMLLFRDDLPNKFAKDVNVVLVDHHVSELAPHVVEILDHRPIDGANPKYMLLPQNCVRSIETDIGSCATIVGQRYLAVEQPRSPIVAQLLHATIVLDTVNFSATAKRFSPSDLVMVEQMERELSEGGQSDVGRRSELFNELVAARADISNLTLTEVLRKDMKIIQTERQQVPIAGMPILIRDFIELSGAEKALREFGIDSNLLVMLGMYVSPVDGTVQRDVGLISLAGQSQLVECVRLALVGCHEPSLDLRAHDVGSRFMGGCYLRQHNLRATRKHIQPVIKRALMEWEEIHGFGCNEVYFFKEKPKLGLS
ncbi:exopolyphosphatase PRUNE1 [Drosophila pseudoobscura]|uniref:Exopolyphosphatase PRUNE1 n=2 Tax=pseudoobscura subgroup TaxID=32358 RepID=Q29JM0_DROPS|nr:exopolyphosphatase PRUNE1 [Drosophila pseudoobscura]